MKINPAQTYTLEKVLTALVLRGCSLFKVRVSLSLFVCKNLYQNYVGLPPQ